MMPTMQEIDRIEQYGHFSSGATFEGVSLKILCAAARRGVEADAEIARLQSEVANRNARALEGDKAIAAFNAEYERAEKAEAELAALKVERGLARDWVEEAVEYVNSNLMSPSLERDGRALFASLDAALKAAQPERVSVPISDERIDAVFTFARAYIAAAQEGK